MGTMATAGTSLAPRLLLLTLWLAAGVAGCWARDSPRPPITPLDPDGRDEYTVTAGELLTKFGYPHERHRVVTEDGYILTMDRIPRPGSVPVLMVPPLFSAAVTYLVLGPGYAQALLLYDAGFDVWMTNLRGSVSSSRHERLSTADPRYWQYSYHEHGVYDVTASVDTVLSRTGFKQLLYVGFSMGSASFLIMTSSRPEYNDKIMAAFLQAPVTALFYSENNLIRIVRATANFTEGIFRERGILALPHRLIREVEIKVCVGELRVLCNFLYLYLSNSPRYMDYVVSSRSRIWNWEADNYFFLRTLPVSGSLPTLWHFAQQSHAPDTFRPYHFNEEQSMRLYGTPVPPNYPLERITAPVYVYRANADSFTVEKDYAYLQRNLRTMVKDFVHPDPLFSHFEFVFSRKSLIITQTIINDMMNVLGSIDPNYGPVMQQATSN
ncbi:lipase 1-like isoform X2 [Thrips palmi]|uniref:Lipase 1-like isoform X2 n=1 Tax=Thrips palmi TaxID=161013 RepID=A0A6P8Y356_THRPL|nr:lipase 1-like isoform X2 [Thrips palmi]